MSAKRIPAGRPGVTRASELVSDPSAREREVVLLQEDSVLPKGVLYLNKGIEGLDGQHIDRMEGYIRTLRGRYFIHEDDMPLSKVLLDVADYNVLAVIFK